MSLTVDHQDARPVEGLESEHSEYSLFSKKMNEYNSRGYLTVHSACEQGFDITKMIDNYTHLIESETTDGTNSTPLLIAAANGRLAHVQLLLQRNARINAITSKNLGVVEMAALGQHVPILEYLHENHAEQINVWKLLVKLLMCDMNKECEGAAKTIQKMTEATKPEHRDIAFSSGLILSVIHVLKSELGNDAREETLKCLLNVVGMDKVSDQFIACAGIAPLVKQVSATSPQVAFFAGQNLKELATKPKGAEDVLHNSYITLLLERARLLMEMENPDIAEWKALVPLCETITVLSSSDAHQKVIGSVKGFFELFVKILNRCPDDLQIWNSIIKALSTVIAGNTQNQMSFIAGDGGSCAIGLLNTKAKDQQIALVDLIKSATVGNDATQKSLLNQGIISTLMRLLKKHRTIDVQINVSTALKAIVGDDRHLQRQVPEEMGVPLLLEYLSHPSDELKYIGSEFVGEMAQGPRNEKEAITSGGGIIALVRLVQSEHERIVLSAIRTLRFLCLDVGYIPHKRSQNSLRDAKGLRFLAALLVYAKNEFIQVEAALTLASACVANDKNYEFLANHPDFNHIYILRLMYNENPEVRLLAGMALATFAYNNVAQQRILSDTNSIRFQLWNEFLESENELYKCAASFQVVVLARVMVDEEQAFSSAMGIKALVEVLGKATEDATVAFAADLVARLAHTRAGVPDAMVAIGAVDHLARHLTSVDEELRGNSAIALGFLTYLSAAEKSLLQHCRKNPELVGVLTKYARKIADSFMERWKHFEYIASVPVRHKSEPLPRRRIHDQPAVAMSLPSVSLPKIQSKSKERGFEQEVTLSNRRKSISLPPIRGVKSLMAGNTTN